MKNIFTLFLLFITLLSFGQKRQIINEYNTIAEIYKYKDYEETSKKMNEFSQKYKGKMPSDVEYYVYYAAYDSYYNLNKNQEALEFLNKTIEIVESDKIQVQDEIIFVNKLKIIRKEIETKLGLNNTTSKDEKVEQIPITNESYEDKTVILTVSGNGKTIEEAKNNALRSAIEQAFGAFISSKTEILNDNLVKDEMLSIANGNIKKFDVISEVQIPDVGYNCILSAVVSISKLTSFIESKGGSSELNGSIYASNLKTKTLEKESEFIAMKNISINLRKYLNSCLDYEISVKSEPKVVSDEYVSVNLEMTSKFNNNIELFKKLFLKSLRGISIDLYNVKEYQKLNIPTYNLWIGPVIEEKVKQNGKIKEVEGENLFILRNKKTYDEVLNLFNLNLFAKRFVINNGAGQIDGDNLFVEPTQNFAYDDNEKVIKDRYMHSTYGYSFNYEKAIREEEKLNGKTKKRVKNLNFSDNLKKYGNVKIIDYDSKLDVFLGDALYKNKNNICKQSTWLSIDTNPTEKILETETELEKNWFGCSFTNPNKNKYGFLINDNELRPMLIFLEKFKLNDRIFSIEFEHLISTQELSSVTNYVISPK